MSDCQHSYVVRNIMGTNRFLCKECNERFSGHPGLAKAKIQSTFTFDMDTMTKFREGMITFAEAVQDTTLAAKDFLEAIQIAFPPMANVLLGDDLNDGRFGTVTSVEPQRTSCPKEIDDFFGNPDITSTDVQSMFDDKIFPDIAEVAHDHSIDPCNPSDPYRTLVTIKFIDDTEQLVYLYPKGHIKS